MFYFYLMLIIGIVLLVGAMVGFIVLYRSRDYTFFDVAKILVFFLLGVLLLWMTLPSLKNVVLKEYDIVSGKCVIEIDTSSRSSVANIHMLESDETFIFNDIPKLDAYGKSITYYCEVKATKDHLFEISYKIYHPETRELIVTSE